MADRQRVELDPAVMAVLGDGERRARSRAMSQGQRRRARRDEARSKATYDLPEELIAAVAARAAREDCSVSGLAGLLMAHGLAALRRGEIDVDRYLQPSRSPRFAWVVDVPDVESSGNGTF
jgi:hypothetical protein